MTPGLNDSPKFIGALAGMVLATIGTPELADERLLAADVIPTLYEGRT
jgi:hypothetical protein